MAQENFDPKEVESLLKHAHFVADRVTAREVRYEALQIPARVEGRDFIFRRVKDPTTGRWVSKLTFRPPPDRTMPSLHLAGLLPPPGQQPVVPMRTLGRALRQLPAEFWRSITASAIIVPPIDSDLARDLQRKGSISERIGDLLVINPTWLLMQLQKADDKAKAFLELLKQANK
jgi:hypothetical protein